MKSCPNCQEMLGDNVDNCFNCRYDFKLGRVPNEDDLKKKNELRREKERIEEEKRKEEAERRTIEQRQRNKEQEEQRRFQQEKVENRAKNAIYEYTVVTLSDNSDGGFNVAGYTEILRKYSEEGWRLKTVFTNEIGRKTSSTSAGGFAIGTNSTIDQTIITFERCVRPERF